MTTSEGFALVDSTPTRRGYRSQHIQSRVPAAKPTKPEALLDPERSEPARLRALRGAWAWAGGRCECKRPGHHHLDRCETILVWRRRGSDKGGGWHARPRVPLDAGGADAAENWEILCAACYRTLCHAERRPDTDAAPR